LDARQARGAASRLRVTANSWGKLRTKKHARTETLPKIGISYPRVFAALYRQIDREN
jgi:hypothetical protein